MESPSSLPSSSPSSPNRQRGIWSNRVRRELERCRAAGALPDGVTLRRAQISESRGVCESELQCFVPFVEGSDALSLVPRIDLVVHMYFSDEQLANGLVQYPFLAPEVEIRHGAIYLPIEMRERKLPKTEKEEPIFLLKLPLLEKWSPSTTLKMLVLEFYQQVQQLDPTPSKLPSINSSLKRESRRQSGCNQKPMRMRKRDVRGVIYPCQEVDPTTATLKPTPMLLQSGNIALLVSSQHGKVHRDGDYVYIQDLISLKDVVRITPQRGKSLTLFFTDRSVPCRTFLSQSTNDIIKDLRIMIDDIRQRSRDETVPDSLLPFLNAEQTDKAKEISTKFISKLGKVATSVSRFLRGDEDDNMEQQEDPLSKAFADINAQKEIFFRTPSKARLTEITRRYQNIAETYARLNNQEGHVERVITELQIFIEHPKAQRILMETVAYERSTKGIRVGPA